ncbi:MAG: hypothetical protein Q7J47_15350 [Azoarcus sp.]|nr:hypothetical protein [Azoarcus sp.]
MKLNPSSWPINDDADSELRFWAKELRGSVVLGAIFALAMGIFIALLPKGSGYPGGEFMGNFWPGFVEVAFWLGMLTGLLMGASKRLGMALASTLPWQKPRSTRENTGRFFGQWSAFAAVSGFLLWLAYQFALAAGMTEVASVMAGLKPLGTACWLTAALFAAVAIAHRPRRGGALQRLAQGHARDRA